MTQALYAHMNNKTIKKGAGIHELILNMERTMNRLRDNIIHN
jgi:hypothetical protein